MPSKQDFYDKKIHFFTTNKMINNDLFFKVYLLDDNMHGEVEHAHDYMQIWYVFKGACKHFINYKEYIMVKGDMFVIPPYVSHKVKSVNDKECCIIGCEFSPKFFDPRKEMFSNNHELFEFPYLERFLVSEEMVKPKVTLAGENQIIVENLMKDTLLQYEKKDKYYEMIIKANILKMLAVIAREEWHSVENTEEKELIKNYEQAIYNGIEYMNENYNIKLHLEDLCRHTNISKTYFCYMFKEITGKTFTEYLIELRINKALELLGKSDISITDICYKVGFNDLTHFSRTFKKIVGVSPRYYRNSITTPKHNLVQVKDI